MTRSLSNMIKAYSVRYKEETRVIDVEEREDAIHARVAQAAASASFVGGLRAIALEEQEGELLDADGLLIEGTGPAEDFGEEEGALRVAMDRAAIEAWKEEERKKLKCELTEAEKIALRIEMEKAIRTQADIILEQARAQGEMLKSKVMQAAEEEKAQLLEAAKQEGYEAGRQQLLQEQQDLEASYAEKEEFLEKQYEKKLQELEPAATEVVIRLLESLTGICLDTKRGIVTYLVTKALSDVERSNSFLIKVSKEDFEEVRGAADSFRAMFEREVTLEVVQDSLLHKGECMVETDSNIIDCSLGTQLEGLIEDIRLLGVQERV